MEALTDVGDYIDEKRQKWLEYQEDFFEWFGFFIHRHQNTSLIFCFSVMWVLATMSTMVDSKFDHRNQIRMATSLPYSYSHWMALRPYLGDNLGTTINHAILFVAGSNSQDGNILTADRWRDIMAYGDMVGRAIHVCRHKMNGKVKVKCDHPMARKFGFKYDCYQAQKGHRVELNHDGELYYMRYDANYHKTMRAAVKKNFPGQFKAYYTGLPVDTVPEVFRGTEFEWTAPCPTCKIHNIKGDMAHCLSEQSPFRNSRFVSPENRYNCKCSTFQFGKSINMTYKGYEDACERCWNEELDEPMPQNMFQHGLMGWVQFGLLSEAAGRGRADGKTYEAHSRFALRTGMWKDSHVRRWFRHLYDDPNMNLKAMILGLNDAELKSECGLRDTARAKCVAWKQQTGEKYAIGPYGEARCTPLKKYEQCIERNIYASAFVMPFQLGLPRWGAARVNPYKNEYNKAWEKEVLGYIVGKVSGHQMAALSHVKPYFLNHCAYGRELGRLLIVAVPWYFGGGFILACTVMLFMGRIDWIDGRYLLALFSVFSGTACLFGAYGIAFLVGGKGPIAGVLFLYLVVIAVAVDDMVIIVDAFEKIIPPKDQVQTVDDRIAWKISQSLREVGPSITLTTATTCMAFFTGALTAPSNLTYTIREILFIGFYAFLLDFFYQLFFFVPLLMKDEKRRLKSRWGCAPCCCEWPDTPPGRDEDRLTVNRGYLSVFCERFLFPAIFNVKIRIFFIILFSGTTIFSMAVLPTLHKKSLVAPRYAESYSKMSYAREAADAAMRAKGTDESFFPGWFVLKNFNAKSKEKRQHLRMFLDHLTYHYRTVAEQDYEWFYGKMTSRKGTTFSPWPRPVRAHILEKFHNDKVCACAAQDNKCPHPYTGEMIQYGPCSQLGAAEEMQWGPGFAYKDPEVDTDWPDHFIHYYRQTYREQLNMLLATPNAGMPEKNFVFVNSNDGSKITYIIRMKVFFGYRDAITAVKIYKEALDIMESYQLGKFWDRDTCYASNFKDCGSFLTIDAIDISERAVMMMSWTWEVLISLDFAMWFTLIFWLPFWASTFATFVVFCLQQHIWGIAYIYDMQLAISFTMVMTVTCGICVDEVTHCIFALIKAYGTPEERLHHAVVGHGPSILKGALSTMVGVTMLSGSTAAPFWEVYFYVIFYLCILGSIFGIFMTPCILIFFLGDRPHPDDLCFDDDFDKQQVEMGNIGADGLSVVENTDSSFRSKVDSSHADSRVD